MVKSKNRKNEEVEYLKKELAGAENVVVVRYKGLSVALDTELRNKVRASGSKYRVIKNRLANIAAAGTGAEGLASSFVGPTAIAYNSDDPASLAKALSDFAKENPVFEFKAGMVEGRVVDISTLAEIAAMPSYEELIAQLMYLINSPGQGIAVSLQAVSRNLAVALGQAVEGEKFSVES